MSRCRRRLPPLQICGAVLAWCGQTVFRFKRFLKRSFEEADLTDADFTDAYIGQFDQKRLCKNPKLKGENPKTGAPTRESAGCKPL